MITSRSMQIHEMGQCYGCQQSSSMDLSSSKDPFHTEDLQMNNFAELRKFTFAGLTTKARVVDVYDGDTITIVFYHQDQPIKDGFRMLGYDSPEMKPLKTLPNRELHIRCANIARKYLQERILNQIVWVRFVREEKYGRLMGELFLIDYHHPNSFTGNEENINTVMIQKGLGKVYNGNHKEEFTNSELEQIISLDVN